MGQVKGSEPQRHVSGLVLIVRQLQAPSFREARDLLLHFHGDYHGARSAFVWPRPERFNWALEWFDAELAASDHGRKTALKIIGDGVETRTFADLAQELSQLANGLRRLGAKRGDRLLMMLGWFRSPGLRCWRR